MPKKPKEKIKSVKAVRKRTVPEKLKVAKKMVSDQIKKATNSPAKIAATKLKVELSQIDSAVTVNAPKIKVLKNAIMIKKNDEIAELMPPKIDLLPEGLAEETVAISQGIRKSSHVINLKNPHQELFSGFPLPLDKPSLPQFKPLLNDRNTNPPKSPKITAKRINKININFADKNRISQLSVVSLFKVIFWPAIFLVSKLHYKKDHTIREQNISQVQETVSPVFVENDIEDIFAPKIDAKSFGFYLPANWFKKVGAFAVIAVILILPLEAFTYYQDLQTSKDKILLITNQAIENLKLAEQAATTMDLAGANSQFIKAQDNFNLAQQEVDNLRTLATEIIKLLPGKGASVDAGISLLEAGEIVSDAGQILIAGGNRFLDSKNTDEYYSSLINFQVDLETVINKFNEAQEKIKNIKLSDLTAQHRETFEKVLGYLPKISSGLTDIYAINGAFLKMLGNDQWQRYLLIFLNNNELRGGGGFMGSFGILDIDRGKIKNLEIPAGGTYDIQGQLVPKVISPQPLHLINPRWEFQDANWWPDFPTTAKKIQWFYQNANGPSTDGVIGITSTLLERLLEIFGPIPMAEYGREINSQNFVAETQKIVQLEYDKEENRPKQFIADLAPKLMQKIFNASGSEMQSLAALIKTSLNEKQLLVYFNDDQVENIVKNFGWSAEIKKTDGDYLSVVHTNLAGGKTDGVIDESIEHRAEIQPDGSIIDTVKLTRHHTGIPRQDIFTGVQNNSYVRFYAPLGSTLLDAQGFKMPPQELFEDPLPEYQKDVDLISYESEHVKDEKSGTDIYNESAKTVFGNWIQLKPGEVKEVTIKYRLPFMVALEGQNTFYYSLLVQKQLGSLGSKLKSNLTLNNNLKILAKFPSDLPSETNQLSFSDVLNTDKFYGAVLVTNKYE